MSSVKAYHQIFEVIAKRSNNFRRSISVFRTQEGLTINLDVYDAKEGALENVCIGICGGSDGFNLRETYRLYSDGSGEIMTEVGARSTTGRAWHSLEEKNSWKPEAIIGDEFERREWLLMQLDKLAEWLGAESTVRVDPYHHERVLLDEEEDVDRWLNGALNLTENFRRSLRARISAR